MLDLVSVDGHAKGIIVRDLVTGAITRHNADAVVLATGGYGNVFNLSTYARGSNATAIWRAYKRGALLRQSLLHADPPDVHPGQRRLPVEAHAHVGVPPQRRPHLGAEEEGRRQEARRPDSEAERDYYLERIYPSFGNLAPRDIASRAAKRMCDEGRGVGETGLGVYLDFADAIKRLGEAGVRERYGNLFDIYTRSPPRAPTRPRCASIPRCTTPWAACGWTIT